MSYTQTLTMAQIRGTAGYNLGTSQNRFGVGAGYNNMKAEATNDPSPLEAIRAQTSKIEDWLDALSEPVRPYVFSSIKVSRGAFWRTKGGVCEKATGLNRVADTCQPLADF